MKILILFQFHEASLQKGLLTLTAKQLARHPLTPIRAIVNACGITPRILESGYND